SLLQSADLLGRQGCRPSRTRPAPEVPIQQAEVAGTQQGKLTCQGRVGAGYAGDKQALEGVQPRGLAECGDYTEDGVVFGPGEAEVTHPAILAAMPLRLVGQEAAEFVGVGRRGPGCRGCRGACQRPAPVASPLTDGLEFDEEAQA